WRVESNRWADTQLVKLRGLLARAGNRHHLFQLEIYSPYQMILGVGCIITIRCESQSLWMIAGGRLVIAVQTARLAIAYHIYHFSGEARDYNAIMVRVCYEETTAGLIGKQFGRKREFLVYELLSLQN